MYTKLKTKKTVLNTGPSTITQSIKRVKVQIQIQTTYINSETYKDKNK